MDWSSKCRLCRTVLEYFHQRNIWKPERGWNGFHPLLHCVLGSNPRRIKKSVSSRIIEGMYENIKMAVRCLEHKNGSAWPAFLWQNLCQNHVGNPNCLKIYIRVCKWWIFISLKYILWYEFLNDLDAQSDFDKNFVTKKAGQVEPFLS